MINWISIKEKRPTSNGEIQNFLVCRELPWTQDRQVIIETQFFTDKFQNEHNITYWSELPELPEEYR